MVQMVSSCSNVPSSGSSLTHFSTQPSAQCPEAEVQVLEKESSHVALLTKLGAVIELFVQLASADRAKKSGAARGLAFDLENSGAEPEPRAKPGSLIKNSPAGHSPASHRAAKPRRAEPNNCRGTAAKASRAETRFHLKNFAAMRWRSSIALPS